jgi:hypothetical protein
MARPQTPFTPKPAKVRKTGLDKMRMSYDRMRRDIKRIEAEQAKAAAAETPRRGRK